MSIVLDGNGRISYIKSTLRDLNEYSILFNRAFEFENGGKTVSELNERC